VAHHRSGHRGDPEQELRQVLLGEHTELHGLRRRMRLFPSDPRCKLCAAPFGGVGGAVLRHLGHARFDGNPSLCNKCIIEFQHLGVAGVEIPVTLLFADVRGSTGLAEGMRPAVFRAYLDRLYHIASEAILGHDGLVDKIVGDEVIGLFFQGVTGPDHAAAGIRAGTELLEGVARPDATPRGPIPVGVGVHTGEAYVGTTGPAGAVHDFTALGDAVNLAARLASLAAAGELLVTTAAASEAGWPGSADSVAEARRLEIRGRQEAIDVLAIRPSTAAPAVPAGGGTA
jgi:adenylate cyclase